MLSQGGIDAEDALTRRFGGNEKLFLRLLGKFLKDTSYQNFETALDAGDLPAARNHLHCLKGVAGNLGMNDLWELCRVGVLEFDDGKTPSDLSVLKETYGKAIDAIDKLPS